ncbi:hypothetical protein N9499_04680 [Octadecabacter sp.]|nr:hypothetical protein [Octadecabacter sp.]
MSRDDMNAALGLAQLASECSQARLRVIGQHAEEYGTVEDAERPVRSGRGVFDSDRW